MGPMAERKKDASVCERILKIKELKNNGAGIDYYAADISDYTSVAPVLENAIKKYGPVNGVVHCAGLPDYFGVIQRRKQEETIEIMKPKVEGVRVLEKILKQNPPDFFVVFSSLGNILYKYKYGQIGYNCGNEFLDSYPDSHGFGKETFVSCINWDDWSESGMTVKATQKRIARSGLPVTDVNTLLKDGINDSEGIDVFYRSIDNRIKRVVISTRPLQARISRMDREVFNIRLSAKVDPDSHNKNGKTQPVPQNNLYQTIAATFSEFFNKGQVNENDNFFELGGDSLKAINLVSKLSVRLNRSIPLEVFFQSPSIKDLVEYVRYAGMQSAASNDGDTDANFILFNKARQKIVFCFPPAVAYGLAYKKMAEHLSDYCFCCFNYIEDESRWNEYMNIITALQPSGPYVFLGYSAGGGLAFETAKFMETKGHHVSDIILLDTYIYRHYEDPGDNDFYNSFVEEAILTIDTAKQNIKDNVRKKIRDYYQFSNSLLSSGVVNSNLHLLCASDREFEEEKTSLKFTTEQLGKISHFRDLCKGDFKEYPLQGKHNDLFDDSNFMDTVTVVQHILKLL